MWALALLLSSSQVHNPVVDPPVVDAPVVDPPPVGLRLRVDPVVTVVACGASVGFDVVPRGFGSRLSVAAFVVDVPRFLVPFVVDHDPRLKITESAVQLGLFTSADVDHRGFFAGPELYAYQLRYVDEDAPARADVAHELYLHATAGYVWFPFDDDDGDLFDDVFVMPWATLGLPVWRSGGAEFADGSHVEDRAFNWHATVSLGLQLF
jgi:hypothetical protein